LVFGHNDFSCGVNDLKNYILPPLVVYPAKKAVKPPFSNFGSDQASFGFWTQLLMWYK
jgi:hypothetical protein